MFAPSNFLNLDQTEHRTIFDNSAQVWDVLKQIGSYLQFRLKPAVYARVMGRPFISENVYVGSGTVIENGATIKGPAWIGNNCEIRSGCYIRENVIIGDGCVVGNSSELKNSLLFNGAQVPHYNYIGDSILGHKAHLGAGVKISNVKLFPGNIEVEVDGAPFDTGLRKFGALLGDGAEVGCNAVLNPGSIIGRGAAIYPNVFWRGILPANMIAKNKAEIEVVINRVRGKYNASGR